MKLVYRGAGYEQTPAHGEIGDSGLIGNYRGHEFHFHQSKRQATAQSNVRLHYRGATYDAHVNGN